MSAVLTLGLGIGLSTAVFTVADALLLRRLPVRDQGQIVALWGEKRDGSENHWPLGIRQVHEFSRDARTLSSVAYVDYYGAIAVPVIEGTNVTQMRRALVSGNYFSTLGSRAELGRTLEPSDDVLGAAPVLVISHAAWQREFGSDPHVVGRRLTFLLDGVSYAIVGVMPAGLEYPAGADFWAAYAPARLRTAADSGFSAVDVIARLAANVTPQNAQSDLTSYLTRPGASAWSRALRGSAHPLPEVVRGDVRPAVLAFLAAAALLLLIACIDVANLLLLRRLARTREFAIRVALGGERSRVIGQLLAENAVLAVAGGAMGALIAAAAIRGFLAFVPTELPLVETIRMNGAALGVTMGVSGVALLLFGVMPAIFAAAPDVRGVLGSGTRQTANRASSITRESLVAVQVMLAVMVLSAASLVGKSLMKLQNATLAFDSSHLVIAELGLRTDQYADLDKQLAVLRTVRDRVRALPGVEAASPVVAVPYSGTAGWTGRAGSDGQSPEEAANNPMFNMELVTPDYFTTFGLRVLRGRALTDTDVRGAEPVVVISEGTASAYWPNQNPIGKRLRIGGQLKQSFTVVGIVPDTRYRDLREMRGSVYYPLAQSVFPFPPTTLAIRVTGEPASITSALRRAVADAAPGVVLVRAGAFNTYMRAPLAQPRLNAYLLGIFALAAATLAAIGLFGVMSTMVRQRRRELGIRMALGATSEQVMTMLVGRGLAIAGVGIVIGIGGSLLATRLVSALLYQVSPADSTVFIGVTTFLLAIALLSSFAPARIGSRIDPAIALRLED